MAALSLSDFDAMMKELYPDDVAKEVAFRKHNLLGKIKKKDDFEGDAYVVPIVTGGPAGGRSASLSTAITNASGSTYKKFVITTKPADYVVWDIAAVTIYASRSKRGAFVEARKMEADLALKQLGNSIAHTLYGDGTGAIGIVGGVPVGNVITLATARDTRNFAVGQVLISDDTATGASPRSGTMVVEAIDEDAGTIEVDTLVVGTTTSDYLFVEGDASAKAKGLAAWFPLTTPAASPTFHGLNRALQPTLLAGTRIDQTSLGPVESVSLMLETLHERGGDPDYVFVSPGVFNTIARQTESTVQRTQGGKATFGFKEFEFQYSGGSAMITADPDCPANRGYALDMSSLWITHLEGLPHIVRDDGRDSMRGATTDTVQMRARCWWELVCNAPAHNGVCSF